MIAALTDLLFYWLFNMNKRVELGYRGLDNCYLSFLITQMKQAINLY